MIEADGTLFAIARSSQVVTLVVSDRSIDWSPTLVDQTRGPKLFIVSAAISMKILMDLPRRSTAQVMSWSECI